MLGAAGQKFVIFLSLWAATAAPQALAADSLDPHFPEGPSTPSIPAPKPTAPSSDGSTVNDSQVEEWPGKIGDEVIRGNFRLGDRFSDWLFEAIDDITLLKLSGSRVNLRASLHRRVFDNHDVANTWTVVDNSRIQVSVPLYSRGLLPGVFSNEIVNGFGLSIGTELGIDLINIRQIRAADSVRVQPRELTADADKLIDEINKPENHGVLADEPVIDGADLDSSADESAAEAGALGSLSYFDPFRKARYGRFWNLFTFPSRIPLKPETLAQLEDGEIISYNLSGAVQVGASVGWVTPLNQVFTSFFSSLYASAYIKGEFRITILKEDSTHAKVKLTRVRRKGHNYGIRAETDQADVVHGLGVVGRWLDKRFFIAPFKIELDKNSGDTFDVGYRYDLTKPEAQKAYKLAVLGRLGYSDELIANKDSGVTKVFKREAKINSETFSQGVHLFAVFRHNRTSVYSTWDATITLPDGTRRVVSAEAVNSNEWKLFWTFYERFRYRFNVSSDLDRAASGHRDALYLAAEFSVEDSSTSGEDLLSYIDDVESAVNEPGIFPRLPKFGPLIVNNSPSRLDYGRTSFFYRLVFHQDLLEKFIAYPDELMWSALERAFEAEPGSWSTPMARFWVHVRSIPGNLLNIPLSILNLPLRGPAKLIHASGMQDDWAQLKKLSDLSERTRMLGHIFRDSMYSKELVRLLRIVLVGESVQYVASGSASSFGRIWKQGRTRTDFHPVIERANREIDFDHQGPRSHGDEAAVVTGLTLEPLGQGAYQLILGTSVWPRAVYIRVAELDPENRRNSSTAGEFIVYNRDGRLILGTNTVILDPRNGDSWATVAKAFELGKTYTVSFALTQDGHNWGPISTVQLTTPAYFE